MTSPLPPLDLVLTGATLLTADPRQPLIENAVVGVSGGRFVLVESASRDKPRPQARRVVDLDGRVITPGLVNIHTHAILTMVRGVAEDLGFAPAYTPGIPQGHMVTPDEAYAISRLGALEAMLFGSTLINDT
ncbi:MAG: 5-methylthioadenosine/S-adenosylhomocysteine deaminase, partial [Rhodospirillaceae bacterium]|nr:5-methylthioadenosine/S-adenosylhomocysteine deaminase [Rhodospirillaceae bacterium]